MTRRPPVAVVFDLDDTLYAERDYVLSGFRALDPFWPFALGTILACTAWALLWGRGPLERIVATLTRLLVPR